MLPKTMTTAELQRATGYSKAAITAFEQAGTIRRDAENEWPFDTVLKIIAHLRERRSMVSDERARWEKAKAVREELRMRRECHELVKRSDFDEGTDAVAYVVLKHLAPLPARLAGRDLAVRKRVERELRIAPKGMSDEIKAMGEKMAETGKAV